MAQTPFSSAELRHHPLQEVTAAFALPHIVKLGPRGRAPYLEALAQADARLRPLVLLETCRRWLGRGDDGLYTFYNTAGDLAPEVVAAFEALGLPQLAAVVRKALGMFAEPYERDNAKRRTKYFAPGTRSWDEQLEAFTYEIEAIRGEPYFGEAVLEFARSRDLIPR